jgi:putative transcriptional regulator
MDLKQLRKSKKLRTVDVASIVGVGESTVRNWEKGRTIPTLDIYQTSKILELYSISFEEFKSAVDKSQGSAMPLATTENGIAS